MPSLLRRLRTRIEDSLFARIGTDIVERRLRERGVWLYRYAPETDRLFPYRRLGGSASRSDPSILSDNWYRVLRDRDLAVPVAFDVGVNYGYTSAWLSRWADAVYAFEPNPNNQAMVREHLRVRGITNVELVPTAVSDEDGQATLHVKPYDGHHSLADIGASETIGTVDVSTMSLDTFARSRGIDRVGILKIDTEGFEGDVLRGATNLLTRRAVDIILFEYSPHFYAARGIDVREPVLVLEAHGYTVVTLDGVRVDPDDPGITAQCDLIAEPS